MIIMSAEDFLDASQKILKLKVNKKQFQEVAIVITETCAQEEKFNKYYAFLADNLIKVQQNLKFSFQYALWDHLKLLDKYTLRKIANLAKFTSFLVGKRSFGLQILRSFDFEALNKHQEIFLQIFFRDFLDKYNNKFIVTILVLKRSHSKTILESLMITRTSPSSVIRLGII